MSKSGQSALDRLKEIANVHATGRKRKGDADENHKEAKGGPGQGTFGGEGFTDAQLNQLARLIDYIAVDLGSAIPRHAPAHPWPLRPGHFI